MQSLSRQQLIAWLLVGLVVLLVGGNYLRSHLSPDRLPQIPAMTVGLADDGGKTGVSAADGEGPSAKIKVHVAGSVAAPGMYELDQGDRAADALSKAGGALPGADLDQVNLAAILVDGQQLLIPEKGTTAAAAAAGAGGPQASQIIHLNSATAEQLTALDGVGEKTAQKIIAYRNEHGGFKNVEELMEVPGIGPSKFEAIKDQVAL